MTRPRPARAPAIGRPPRTTSSWARRVAIAGLPIILAVLGLRQLARARSVQLLGSLVARVNTRDSVVALTFDDGPVAALTDSIRSVLRARGVRATFFVTGRELALAPGSGRSLLADGHELGNHTYSHRRMVLLSPASIEAEIVRTDSILRAVGVQGRVHVRPPYGWKLLGLPWYLWRTGRTTVMWDIEPESDPEVAARPERIVRHVLDRVRPGSVILLHPWYRSRATSLAALPMLVDSLVARGYRLVTVDDLLRHARTH